MRLLGLSPTASAMSDPVIAAFVRAAKIEALVRLAPFSALTSGAVAIVFLLVFGRSTHGGYVLVLTVAVVATALFILGLCWYWSRKDLRAFGGQSVWTERIIVVPATIMGLLWASMPAVLFPDASADERLMIASTAAGLVAIGMVFASVTPAAFSHSGLIVVGSFVGLSRSDHPFYWIVASLLAVYGLFILNVIEHLGRLMLERALDQASLDRQKEVIGLLLCDFEENASDWLWETDSHHRIQHASARFAQVAGRAREDLQGRSLLTLATAGPASAGSPPAGSALGADGQPVAADLLTQRLRERTSFRGVTIPVQIDGRQRWWSLTGRAMTDAEGRFTGFRGVGSDVTDAKTYEERIAYLARYDVLTGLPNRTAFREALAEAAVGRPGGEPAPFALLCLDLDGFKAVNDTFGHSAGDALLAVAATRLKSSLREGDTVARLAGDEFAVLARSAGATVAAELSRRIIEAIGQPFAVEGVEIAVGVSIGIALSPENGDDLLKSADLALYRAKHGGRGTFRFYESDMDARVEARRALESDLRGALARDEFQLLFQPILGIETLAVSGHEALLRWNCSARGRVSPADFIPVAEETGLIIPIGEWVLEQACRTAMRWPAPLRVTVNLSAVQFRSPRLAFAVISALGLSGLSPDRLELEITESILLEEKDSTLRTLHDLRALGIRIALDDFGTGYSSLSYLRSFPFDKIKIDQSFVRSLGTTAGSRAIVEAIVVLARHLGMTTTAEGVETPEQVEALRAMGCSEVQGFLFSPPRPVDELVDAYTPAGWPGPQAASPREASSSSVSRLASSAASVPASSGRMPKRAATSGA